VENVTIQNEELFMGSLWDWGILNGCFGNTKIKPTDVDGLVERNGHFLVLEAKRPGVKIKAGQWWTINALRNTGLFTTIIIWGERNQPEQMQVIYPIPYAPKQPEKAGITELRDIVSRWFQYAEKKRRSEANANSIRR